MSLTGGANCLLKVVFDVKLVVGCSPVRVQSPVSAIGRLLPYLLNAHGSSHCILSLVISDTVVAVAPGSWRRL